MNVDRENAAEVARVAKELSRPFNPKAVKFKPTMVKQARALALAYIDARLVMDRLDKVVHVDGWRDEYTVLPTGEVECRLTVRIGGQWVTKADVGSPSEQPDAGDRMKAAYSDALKRAAVKFGVGRYLYRLPQQWVDYDPARKRITQVPQLPAFALPDAVDEDEDSPDDAPAPEPEPAARPAAPPQSPPPAGRPAANPALRARYAQRLAQCPDQAAYSAICCDVGNDLKAGLIGEEDKRELRPLFEQTAARVKPKTPPQPTTA